MCSVYVVGESVQCDAVLVPPALICAAPLPLNKVLYDDIDIIYICTLYCVVVSLCALCSLAGLTMYDMYVCK